MAPSLELKKKKRNVFKFACYYPRFQSNVCFGKKASVMKLSYLKRVERLGNPMYTEISTLEHGFFRPSGVDMEAGCSGQQQSASAIAQRGRVCPKSTRQPKVICRGAR